MGKQRSDAPRPMIEWIFGSISGVLVVVMITFLGYQSLFGGARPPELVVSLERSEERGTGTIVTIAVTNEGDEAAAEVSVHATLSDALAEAAPREIRFDYIAARSVRRGVFVFPDPITGADIHLEIGGFIEP